jgi:hypothetical protein
MRLHTDFERRIAQPYGAHEGNGLLLFGQRNVANLSLFGDIGHTVLTSSSKTAGSSARTC